MECRTCGFVAKTPGGLKVHERRKHLVSAPSGGNAAALEVTLSEFGRLGRFELVDSARVHVARSLAAAVDSDPFNAQMWRQYREALEDLAKVDDDADDGLTAALAAIAGAAEVGDQQTSG